VRRALEAECKKGSTAREMVEAIVRTVLTFSGGKRHDDMTVVVVRRTS
jgi:serine phosphatase RsbU (regulator of sigma subunit)